MKKINPETRLLQDYLPIPGYETYYVINREGKIYHTRLKRFKTVSYNKLGYARVNLSKNGIAKIHYIHRLLMLVWKPIENCEDLEVNHIDGDKGNFSLDNLEWVSHRENIIHARQVLNAWDGSYQSDTRKLPSHAKLTPDKVREIRTLHSQGIKRLEIAKKFDISLSLVDHVIYGHRWKHVE